LILLGAIKFVWRFAEDKPKDYASIAEHFKYGSINSSRTGGGAYRSDRHPSLSPQLLHLHLFRQSVHAVSGLAVSLQALLQNRWLC
jgi:hypothetical protein